jgi:hypothetical protein
MSQPNLATKVVTRLDLSSGQAQSVTSTQAVTRPFPGRFVPAFRDSDMDSGPVFASSSREIFLSGNSAVQMQSKLLEKIVNVKQPKKMGPSVIDSGTLRASQSMEAAAEFMNQANNTPTYEDQSRYTVTLKRLLGSGSSWTGEVTGSPVFFPLRTVDILAAGKSIIAFNKGGQKLWQAKLNYPVAPRFIHGDEDYPPCLESGSRLYFFDLGNLTAFDLKKGDVDWRVESVGISEVNLDSRGKLYVSTTTAGPDQIRPSQDIVVNNKTLPVIMKVDSSSGKILWQVDRIAEHTYPAGDFLYASRAQVSGVDVFSNISNNEDRSPIHHRILRLDPGKGREVWEFYRPKVPNSIEPKGNRILLQYKNEIQMLKFFSL